jgi:penicillin-binding protein 1A
MSRKVKLFWQIFWGGFGFFILILLLVNFGLFGKLPSLVELQNPEADLASEIYSSDDVLMGKYYSQNRSEVKFGEISPNVVNALIATEDERFYEHSGIDVKALARAAFTLGTQGGGSTITQQLAKMMLGQGRKNILLRIIEKLKEWIVAVKLERNFTKEEILTLYLNHAPWGNVYGIKNASMTYFQKAPIDLKIEEGAVLIGMLKGFIYEPIRHPKQSINRRNTVIDQMSQSPQHFISKESADSLKAKPLITNYRKIDENVGMAPYYRSALINELKEWCKENTNPKTGEPYDLYRDGLRIYTTIDSRMQKYAEAAIEQHMPVVQSKLDYYFRLKGKDIWKGHDDVVESAMKFTDRYKSLKEEGVDSEEIRKSFSTPVKMRVFSWRGNERHEKDTIMTPYDSIRYHKQLLQTSFLAMDPRTGEIKAWVGGINFKWFKYDHVTAKRQVGSTFKPLLYTLAITDAGYTPQTYIPGGPLTLGGKTINTRGGTMANCLAWSVNGAAWHLMSTIGVSRTVEFAKQCGIKTKIPPYPSIALGAAEIPMIEMLQAFTMFPNKGYNTEPQFISRIEDKNGNIIKEFPISQSKQIIGEADNYSMVKMLQGVVQYGTGRRMNNYYIPTEKAGKTGTTNGNTDGWFIGFTPELLAGSWVGCEDPFIPIYQNNGGGSEMAGPSWGLFMNKVYSDSKLRYGKIKEFYAPEELKNDPIYADLNFANIVNSGDSLNNTEEIENADDFLDIPVKADNRKKDSSDKGLKKATPKYIMPTKSVNKKTKTENDF